MKAEGSKVEGEQGVVTVDVSFTTLMEVDYYPELDRLKVLYGGNIYSHTLPYIVLAETGTGVPPRYIGGIKDLIEFARVSFGFEDAEVHNDIAEKRCAREDTQAFALATKHKYVFIEFAEQTKKGSIPYGKVVIELFHEICPDACENFYKLCTGESGNIENSELPLQYVGSKVHRIVPKGWIQCGDIVDGSGKHSIAATGFEGKVRDESYSVDFGNPIGGIVGFSTTIPHSIGSQFHITTGPCEWMNDKFVGVGRVVMGFDVLRQIEANKTENQRPINSIFVQDCGVEKI